MTDPQSGPALAQSRGRRRFYLSAWLMVAGLVAELISLFGLHHPLGFMFFAAFGCTLMGAGIVMFVLFLLSRVDVGTAETLE